MPYQLSKSKLQSHAQCSRRLWLEVHQRDAAQPDEFTELRLARGITFGDAIRSCFPEGRLIKACGPDEAVHQTRMLFDRFANGEPRSPVFEAAFGYGDVVIYADVLEPCADGSWCLLEIKSATIKPHEPPKQHYVRDVATQAWVLRRCGLPISRVELGQANRDFVLPRNRRIEGILRRVDVTAQAVALAEEIERSVDAALETVRLPQEPQRLVGSQCKAPNKCPFVSHCSGARLREGEQIRVPVWHLAGDATSSIVAGLMNDGFRDLAQVPEDRLTKLMHQTMRGIARGNEPYIDDRLRDYLRGQPFPRYFLDYETNMASLPLWSGTHPGDRVPFQYSVHKWTSLMGSVEHYCYLGDTLNDPRPELARELAAAMAEPGPVYAWNGRSTEGPITSELALAFPEHREVLERVAQSCRDMDPLRQFRDWFYHPAMAGNWGLKAIAGAIFAESPYKNLRIANGVDAMREYERLLKAAPGPARDELREALLQYCNTDTEVMIKIWQALTP
jgi:hypothetical protein